MQLKAGHNVWLKTRADAAAVLIDAAAYYESLWRCCMLGERSVYILGWDIDSRLKLVPGRDDVPGLATFLVDLVKAKPKLEIHLLLWDFSNIYLFGREAFQSIKFALAGHPRIHFHFDNQHPLSASHHQKIVVVDDRIAFCGGIDLTGNRWDTGRHEPEDPLRVNPAGEAYAPFHDVQMAVTGEPARALGTLFRERWKRATGKRLPKVPRLAPRVVDLGPEAMGDATVGIARTIPAFKRTAEVREVERLFADMIEGARRYIYIENQYFSSSLVCRRLSASLMRPSGPEIFMVLPKLQDSWLAKVTMGTMSMRCVTNLFESDRYGRFHPCYPEDTRLPAGKYVNVHAKVMIVDDRYLRVGSANMNNRSMGLDTECDLVLDAEGRPELARGVARTLHRLLADHTGKEPEAAARALAAAGSIREAAKRLSEGSPKSLEVYVNPEKIGPLEAMVGELEVVDLDQPTSLEQAFDQFVFRDARGSVRLPERVPAGLFLTFVLCVTLATVFALSPVWEGLREVTHDVFGYEPQTASEAAVLAAFAVALGGMAFVPFNLMVVAVASLFPAGRAFLVLVAGGMASAILGYAVGRLIGRSALRRNFAAYARVTREAALRQTVLSVFLVRFFPLAPFTLMNLLCGAGGIRAWPYAAGTFLGVLPGTLGLVFFQRSLMALIREPSLATCLLFGLVTLLVTQAFSFLSSRFGSRPEQVRYA